MKMLDLKHAQTCTHAPTCFILASSLRVCSSFLRSFLLPTRMMGTLGQKCLTSGVHFSGMFSARVKRRHEGKGCGQRSVNSSRPSLEGPFGWGRGGGADVSRVTVL